MDSLKVFPPNFTEDQSHAHTFMPWEEILKIASTKFPTAITGHKKPGCPVAVIATQSGVRFLWVQDKPMPTRYVCRCDETLEITQPVTECECGTKLHAQQNSKGIWYVTRTERPRYKD